MLTPDGARYLAASHQRVARPFHLRWLLPTVLGDNQRRWEYCTRLSVLAIGVLCGLYTHSVWMAAVCALPGITFNWRHPVLVDAPAMATALAAAVVFPHCWPAAVALALLSGTIRETAPVWAAIYAWNPLLLVGLLPVAARAVQRQGDDVLDSQNAWILAHPFKASQAFHLGQWSSWQIMVAPWATLVASVAGLTTQLIVALAAGYGQLLIATDSVRLYQWAAPVLALACVHMLPSWALPLVALSIIFNPFRGEGL